MIIRTPSRILSFLFITILCVSLAVAPIKKIHASDLSAGSGSGWSNFGAAIAKFLGDVPGTESAVMDQVKSFALDVVGKAVATSILQTMATEVINWAGSGFEGNPFAVENQNNHMYDIKSSEIVRLYNEVSGNQSFGGFTNTPAFKSLIGVVEDELKPFTEKIKPTISAVEKIDFKNDFTKGGWNTYIKQADMQNNSIGTRILTLTELDKRVTSRQHAEEQKLLQGAGIQAATKCVGGFISDADTGFEYCKNEVVSTAGKLVGDQIGKAIGSSMDQSTQSSASGDLGSIVSSMLSGVLTDLIYKGLGSIGGGSPAPVDPFASLTSLVENDPNFQTSGSSKYNAREIVDINKELNAALELTKKDINSNLLPTISTLSGPILILTTALDQCVPGPDLGFEDRLQRYFRIAITQDGLEEDAREDGGELASLYAKVNMAFGQYLGNVENLILQNSLQPITPRFDGPLQWLEQVKEIKKHGTTLANLQDMYNEKQKVLVRLQSIKTNIVNQSGQIDVILFNDSWNTLSAGEKESRFNEILSSMIVSPEDWQTIPAEEKQRIARLFNENALNWNLDSQQKSERLAFYELFGISILNTDGLSLNTEVPNDTKKRDSVISAGWKKWEEMMNENESSQEQKILIIRNLVESRNIYTTERSYDTNRARLEGAKASEKQLTESIMSCQKARYEIVNANEVIPNKRTLVLPIDMPEASEITTQASITFNSPPNIQRIRNIIKVDNSVYIQASYSQASIAWVEYSNYNNLDSLQNEAINRSMEQSISRENRTVGEVIIQLSGSYNSATDNNSTIDVGDQDLSINSLTPSSNSIYFKICAQNNLGTTCTNQEQTNTNNTELGNAVPEASITQNYDFEGLSGYNYFRPLINIPIPPGINVASSPAVATVIEAEIIEEQPIGRITGKIAGGGTNQENPDRRLLRLNEGGGNPACHPAVLFLTAGASAAGCAAGAVAQNDDIDGIPIMRSAKDRYKMGLAAQRSVAFEIPFYKPSEFIANTIAEGNPATHQPEPSETYAAVINNQAVIVVRNWHWKHERNTIAVVDDYTRRHGCDFTGFGTGEAGTGGGKYYGPHCNPTEDKDSYSFWYSAKPFDYLIALYPKLKQYVR